MSSLHLLSIFVLISKERNFEIESDGRSGDDRVYILCLEYQILLFCNLSIDWLIQEDKRYLFMQFTEFLVH